MRHCSLTDGRWLSVLATFSALVPGCLNGQTIAGRVLDAATGSPVQTVLVRLLTTDSAVVATTFTNHEGHYELTATAPGIFLVQAEHLGYFTVLTPAVSAATVGATYGLDMELRLNPVAMEGITVTAERRTKALEQIRSQTGLNPRSLARRPVLREAILRHIELGHNLVDLIRSTPSLFISIRDDAEGACFLFRSRYCLRVHLDGDPVGADLIWLLPLEMIESVTILLPNESIVYREGAVLLFTAGPSH